MIDSFKQQRYYEVYKQSREHGRTHFGAMIDIFQRGGMSLNKAKKYALVAQRQYDAVKLAEQDDCQQ